MSSENILTFDVEEWHDRNDVEIPEAYTERSFVEDSMLRLLDLLDRYGARATFFILGYISREHPALLRQVHDAGHEVGVHHLEHNLLYDYSPREFRREVRLAKDLAEDAIGDRVQGFRAPSWSIDESNMWALDVLAEEGFDYDSSVFPLRNHLYGVGDANPYVHRPSGDIIEVPPTVFEVTSGVRVPFATGFFFRVMPEGVVKRLIALINERGQPAVVALHPWEVFPDFERPPLPVHRSIIPYAGLDGCGPKLEGILETYEFGSVREVVLT